MFKGIGVVPNWQKNNVAEVLEEIKSFFQRHDVPVFVAPSEELLLNLTTPVKEFNAWAETTDLVIVIGGDGTFLRVARELAYTSLPILGINLGHKGFLAEIEIDKLVPSLQKLIDGDFCTGDRMMLQTEIYRENHPVASFLSLNDVIISRGPFSRIIRLDTYINEDFLESYPGDGMIIASPTGSTGYSLSAGGPVVHPGLSVLVITPICPHLLYQRSVIVAKEDIISIDVATASAKIFLTLDGQEGFSLNYRDYVKVRQADYATKVITFPENNFYKLLHDKLI